MREELRRIQAETGRDRAIIVTHDQEEALTMSDRLAVFNEGKIEQVGAPAEVYEHPANDVRGRASSASRTCSSATASASPIRPEKVRAAIRRAARRPRTSRQGTVRDVAYAGMVTRYLVDLDAGGELQVVRQNLETSSAEALEERGTAGSAIGWREEQTFAIHGEGGGMKRGPWTVVAVRSPRCCRWAWSACGGDDEQASSVVEQRGQGARGRRRRSTSSATGEGKVNLIAWAGYVEDGSTDPKVDWVSDFEKQTGCQVNVKVGNTSDEMVTLMRTGQYDGVSASGDATLRLIAGGDVAPVNTDLVKNYADIFEALKNQPFNSVDGQMYGIPHGRGANLLMWRSDKIEHGAGLVGRGLRPGLGQQGQGHGLRQPDLHRRRGAVPEGDQARPQDRQRRTSSTTSSSRRRSTCSRQQRENIGEYWSDYTKEQAAFAQGDSVLWDDLAGDHEPAARRQGQGQGDEKQA